MFENTVRKMPNMHVLQACLIERKDELELDCPRAGVFVGRFVADAISCGMLPSSFVSAATLQEVWPDAASEVVAVLASSDHWAEKGYYSVDIKGATEKLFQARMAILAGYTVEDPSGGSGSGSGSGGGQGNDGLESQLDRDTAARIRARISGGKWVPASMAKRAQPQAQGSTE